MWNKRDINRKGGCLVVWKMATRQKNHGGLGILDLRAHNIALLIKHMHKFYNKKDISWVQLTWNAFYSRPIPPHHMKKVRSFWWRDIMTLLDHFFMMLPAQLMNVIPYISREIHETSGLYNGNSLSYTHLLSIKISR
jgi:hypothetical protein